MMNARRKEGRKEEGRKGHVKRDLTEWGISYTIPIYKGKGAALLCGKYRGVRLLEHGMKLWEKILERMRYI